MLCLNSEKICSTFVFAIAGSLLSYVTVTNNGVVRCGVEIRQDLTNLGV